MSVSQQTLCTKCRTLPFHHLKTLPMPHYTTFTELEKSSNTGCSLCILFEAVTLDFHSADNSCTKEEARSYHRLLDRESRGETEISSSFMVGSREIFCHGDVGHVGDSGAPFFGLEYVRKSRSVGSVSTTQSRPVLHISCLKGKASTLIRYKDYNLLLQKASRFKSGVWWDGQYQSWLNMLSPKAGLKIVLQITPDALQKAHCNFPLGFLI